MHTVAMLALLSSAPACPPGQFSAGAQFGAGFQRPYLIGEFVGPRGSVYSVQVFRSPPRYTPPPQYAGYSNGGGGGYPPQQFNSYGGQQSFGGGGPRVGAVPFGL